MEEKWHIVGELVTKVVLEVLNEGGDPSCFNNTVITLIPKVKNSTSVSQLRPISLCNVLYKLVSKAIVLRLKPYLSLVISESQSAFLQSRLITDNVLVAFELLHSLKHLKQEKEGYATIKLDTSKVFDRVEWYFLQCIMTAMGFDSTVVNLIIRCISTVTYSFSINGNIQGQVMPTRGIRQGDPLSPYLFIICAEGLSRLFQHEEQLGVMALHCSVALPQPNPWRPLSSLSPNPSYATPTPTLLPSLTTSFFQVVPQADRVLVRLEELPEKSAGGVLLPKSAVKFERYLMGEVLSVGSDVGEVKAGLKVLFSDINAFEVDLGSNSKHCFCKESDLLAVVE
uniref:Reverse transcriptase domain-containing protein n=1 Tax=Cannabis sativa TaxID=3483 RepID=A0A803NHR6_CANSA